MPRLMTDSALRVLFATSECAPLAKTGGLGDVSGALPRALARLGHDVRVLVPAYPALAGVPRADAEAIALDPTAGLPPARIVPARLPGGVAAFLLDCPALYERPGGPYLDPEGRDWPDNALRFAQLARAAAFLGGGGGGACGWRAQVVHANDWQTALAAAYLAYSPRPCARALFTVHNLAYQGLFPAQCFDALGLPREAFSISGLEFHGKVSFLKAGLVYADAISTVSPTYAHEIRHAPLGFGLEGVIGARRGALHGILNGIDTELWNPAADPWIARRYDAATLPAKAANRAALRAELGLAEDAAAPVIGIISRFTGQKGLDLVLAAAERILALPAQLAVLGSGEADLERAFVRLATTCPGRVAVRVGFDEPLAHRIEAGADIFLMPSRFEPCGMNQMYSQRYGTLPVVRATGGLADTVEDGVTGFVFREAEAGAMCAALARALAAWREPALWRRMQRQAMARDFGWERAARRYGALYAQIIRPVSNG
jgi:starch synthase